jgi:hypothetical protein
LFADDDHVLDEDGVRAAVCGFHVDHCPAGADERGAVLIVLVIGERHIDRRPLDVRDDALGQPATRSSYQGHPTPPVIIGTYHPESVG